MNKEEILAMPAGHDLDRLIASKVLNLTYFTKCLHSYIPWCGVEKCYSDCKELIAIKKLPNYSTGIVAAWEIIKFIKENESFSVRRKFMAMMQIIVSRKKMPKEMYCIAWPDVLWHIEPVDICKSALLAVMEAEDEPPYVGSPLWCNWPGYHTHWTRLVLPPEPEGIE